MKNKLKLQKQYGIVNKEVLKNNNISANAKGLYAYFCARAGNKDTCNPTVSRICHDLNICETTFHKLKNELISAGVIDIIKIGQDIKKRNHYKLLNIPKKGFGYIYLDILTDSRLNLKSKAIYGLLASYSGNTFITYTLSKVILTILNIARNTYFKAVKQLKELNYLFTKQLHHNGRFSYCNYYINNVQADDLKSKDRFIFTTNYCVKTINNSNTIKDNNENKITYNDYLDVVKDNIEYNSLLSLYSNNSKAIYWLDNILSVLTNTIYIENKDLTINNSTVSADKVKMIYNKIRFNHITTIINNLLNNTYKINSVRDYLKVTLFNAFYQVENKHFNITK